MIHKAPFLSFQRGRMNKVPDNLEQFLKLYSKACAMFNIQVDGENLDEERAAQARKMLLKAKKAKVCLCC